ARGVRHARWAGGALPLPPARIARIVVIGDTGCRLKAADRVWQACDQPDRWPFAGIAARAAALHPDMVLHVGDYLYRENPCPAGVEGCAGANWGYGEAGWRADFLDPAAPLLAAAPWTMVRGNHEECARAGEGWWRLLDPHRLIAGRDCTDPAQDRAGNHGAPYAVDLGGRDRLVVLDLVALAAARPGDPGPVDDLRGDVGRIAALTAGARSRFVTAHYPLNAVLWASGGTDAVTIGGKVAAALGAGALPDVRAMFAGHIHFFQYARFTDRPSQLVTGFSGTEEDPAIAPATLADAAGKPGSAPLDALTTIAGRFGYALLERHGAAWRLTAFAPDGSVMGRFAL
ncbi:MAG: metallophosphoesterase, partial [Sphingomonadales bacterium]|nr:metallophosphoesterase [Sphingomonadales bacterium]